MPDGFGAAAATPFAGAASVTGRRWLWRPRLALEGADRLAAAISQSADLPEILGRLLHARGVAPDEVGAFLQPTLRAAMPDPSCMTDLDRAAGRLARAVLGSETVGIFGDYDVDGACGVALLALLLRGLGCRVLTHIPDRLLEGYGPNAPALLSLHERGASLVVCVDCGSNAPEPLAALAGRADVVVLDHHKTEQAPPSVLAVVNPNRPDCRSGLGGLCATGVAFLAAIATVRSLRQDGAFAGRKEPDLLGLLDLVALATICDVMPLAGLNRALVIQGLKVMARRERPGIAALLEVAAVREAPSAFTCGYALGPRINAGGRIGEADLGLRLLLSEDSTEAAELALRLDGVNKQRREVEAAILERALLLAEAQVAAGRAVVVLSGPDWHPGVVGIVASRVKERFNRPALVGALLACGTIKGSGRSVAGLDLGAAVLSARASGLLLTGGGHAMAAGFSLEADKLEAFHDRLDASLDAARHEPHALDLWLDGAVGVAGANTALAGQIARLAPFGPGNDEPVLVLSNVRVVRTDRLGKEGATLRVLLEGEGGGPRLKALLFRAGDSPLAQALEASRGQPLHVAGQLRAGTWKDETTASLFLVDAALPTPPLP